LSQACAQEGAAQIGRAFNDLTAFVRQGRSESLPRLVRECYQKRPVNGSVDTIAYCFALDYSASQIDLAIARKSGAEPQAYLSVEKVLTRANRALDAVKIEQAERGPLIAFWANSSRELMRKWAGSEPSAEARSGPIVERAKAAILRLVKEPRQARLVGLELRTTPNMRGEPTQVVCGRVSERTATGAYTPERPFVYFVGDQSVNYDNGREDLDKAIVKNFCVK
jgi:hypothetical protein